MSNTSSERNPVEELAEEFLERFRRGERPALGEYTNRYPELAEQIRDLFPALVMMEDVRPDAGDVTGDLEPPPGGAGGQKLERLGDFRILREVGHGGMGIVYEAEQESLGRHVALKVLLTHSLLDPKQLQRFHREARAAARLHHTNIVPVYGVGEHDGFHYYIMQFIQGQGLDQVLAELKRLREIQGPPGKPAEGSAAAAAQALWAGSFSRAGLMEGSEPQRSAAGATENSSSSTIHLPGQAEHSALTHSSRQYFQSVALIGVQVAEALTYAHGQGILHRDIKPSNLLLDTQGTVWVADFGLAKAQADADLTHTGDIVGTLRYMAPERFNGQSDVRSDLYSLGLTLYELLTLRPAFDEHNRNRLIQQVMHDEPPRPRKLNPGVPRDLETVVLKAIARDPAQRYQTPTELAEDLKRFVEDRPIRARRVGAGERLWRWCRRNPALASLLALVQMALVGLLVLGAWSYGRISQALTETEDARGDAVRLRDEAIAVSYRALLNETQALRLAHASGWRYQALQNLEKLAHLETPERNLVELRGEAVACLGGFDANLETRFLGHTESVWSLDFSPDSKLLATAGYDGRLHVWDVRKQRSVREITDPAVNLAQRHSLSAPLPAVRFHPDGKSLAYATWEPGFGVLGVAGEDPEPAAAVPFPAAARYLGFDNKGKLLAVSWGDGRVCLYDAASRTLQREIRTSLGGNAYAPVALSPDGTLLAATGLGNTVLFYAAAVEKRAPVSLGSHRDIIRSLCFSPSGQLLASASEDQTVKLWKVGSSEEPITLVGHSGRVNSVAFSPDGSLVASASDDETVRLWETQTGGALMVLQPGIGAVLSVAISPDGHRMAAGGSWGGNCPVCLYQLTSRQEQRRLAGHTYGVNAVAFHPSRPLLASGSADRSILLWDLQTGSPAQRWVEKRPYPVQHLAFAPDDDLLAVGLGSFMTSTGADYAIEVQEAATGKSRRLLPGPQKPVNGLAYDPSGTLLAAGTNDGNAFVWNTRTGETLHHWKTPKGIEGVAFVRKGTQLVTGESGGLVVLREVADGQAIQETVIPEGLNCLAPAPDEQTLAVGGDDGTLRILALPGLETSATLEKGHAGKIKAVAFSPDGRLLASGGWTDARVVLWDARTYQRLCTLPQTSRVYSLAFDKAGRRLAICGAESLVTVWDLALVNEELAAAGLDWDASLPKTGLSVGALVDARPAPVTEVKVPRPKTGGDLKPSIVVRPADRRRRTATAVEIAGWVRQLTDADGKVRQAAADALIEVGPPAVGALTAVTEPSVRRQARAVLDRIDAAEVLAPTRVSLKLENALPADAVRALSEKSRIPMTYYPPTDGTSPRRISLNLEDVSVWEALDRLCETGDLGHVCLDGATVQVGHSWVPLPAVRCYAGPFRLHLTWAQYYRHLQLVGPKLQADEHLQLHLGLLTEPIGGLLSIQNWCRVTEPGALKEEPLAPAQVPPQFVNGGIFTSSPTLPLKATERRNERIKVIKGVLPVEVMVRRQDLVTVPDVAKSAGRTCRGEQGHRLTVEPAPNEVPQNAYLRIKVIGPPGWSYDPNLHGVELTDARGRSRRCPNLSLLARPLVRPQPEYLAWLATAPAPSLGGLPWAALALQRPREEQLEWRGLIPIYPPVSFEGALTLRFFRFERLKVEVPFELSDVPLP